MSGVDLRAAVAGLRAAFDEVAACEVDLLTRPDLIEAIDDLETLGCQLPTLNHRLLARLQTEATPQEMGARNWRHVLAGRWRISTGEAHRRLTDAALLAPRHALTGPALPPVLPATAAAAAHGLINAEHVAVIGKAVDKLPGFLDTATGDQFEVDLVRTAVGVGPKELNDAAERTLFLLDQDGPEPDDTARARKRAVTTHRQRRDAMTELTATLTPEAWAVWEVLFAKYAAPGMCNSDDPDPCTCGTPSQTQIDTDQRSLAQRRHDAMIAVGRIALMSGDPGHLNGLPVSVIIRTTLQDLQSRTGIGVTGGATTLPIADVIGMAAHAHHHLAVFDKATGSALDLFRARRTATPAQQIMLIARDGGCTKPGATVGAYGCQVHHVVTDWSQGGNTNVNDNGLACGPDNRAVNNNDGGWTTTMNTRHEVEWTPPPALDTGQNRINYYHQPERLLRPPETPDPLHDNNTEPPESATPEKVNGDAESSTPPPADDPGEPGGPAPPENQAA
jgi:hypothetical protein